MYTVLAPGCLHKSTNPDAAAGTKVQIITHIPAGSSGSTLETGLLRVYHVTMDGAALDDFLRPRALRAALISAAV
jgi:hypothetical protein